MIVHRHRAPTLYLFIIALFLVLPVDQVFTDDNPAVLDTQYQRIRLIRIVDGLEHPWAVAFLPGGKKLVTERPGRLLLIDGNERRRIEGLPEVSSRNQGGLMDIALHPGYPDIPWIYLTYSKPNGSGETATTLIRGRLEEYRLTDIEELFVQNRYSSPGRHYGSRLAWLSDGTLLMSIGDRGADPPRAQDLRDHAGSVIRLRDDGSIPDDNPFVGREDALDEIYAFGFRNIQGMAVEPQTDRIWVTDHGPRGGDELNLVQRGLNYGWPVVTRGLDYRTQRTFRYARARSMEGYIDPVYEFLPTLAPSGLAIVTSDLFPAWRGDLLAGGLRSERIRRLVVGAESETYEVYHDEELLLAEIGRIRDVREDQRGYIYVLTDEENGALYRIEPVQ